MDGLVESAMECGCDGSVAPENFLSHYVQNNFQKRESPSDGVDAQMQTSYTSNVLASRTLQALDTLRKNNGFCDIKLETDDGAVVHAHKVILISATPYFQAMFTHFKESKSDHVILRELNSVALKLLVDYIYTAQIVITEDNVQDLLHATSLLQLQDVKNICCDFLQTLLDPANCLVIKALIQFYYCEESLPNFQSFILNNFTMVVQSEEFLCLQYEELVEFLSNNDLNVSSEEIVFECVIKWVNHNLSSRKDVLSKLMEHVRLPLLGVEYLQNKVCEEPLIKKCPESNGYLLEALRFKSDNCPDTISQTIRTKPRHFYSSKIILVIGKMCDAMNADIQWYDDSTNTLKIFPKISTSETEGLKILGVLNNRTLFFSRDCDDNNFWMIDLFSPCVNLQRSIPPLLNKRPYQGVGILNNCIYVVGGSIYSISIKFAEVFNSSTQTWDKISEMSTARSFCGVGALNNHLYAVGGFDQVKYLKSAERYCPNTDTWTPVEDMTVSRCDVGVGVLNGVMYVVGGNADGQNLKYVEAYNPSSNTWTLLSSMNYNRNSPGVVALNGLLYVFCGNNVFDGNNKTVYDYSAEMYDPKTDVWTILTESEFKSFLFS